MPVIDRPALGYFRVQKHPTTGNWHLVLAASEDGPVEWQFRLDGSDQRADLTTGLARYLETELVRNVEPVYAASVLQATSKLELNFTLEDAILDAIVQAGQPTFDWDTIATKVDRLQRQLDYLKHLLDNGILER